MREAARRFFTQLLAGDVRALSGEVALPFQLEGRSLEGREELLGELLRQTRSRRGDRLTLDDVDVLSPAEMEARYGRPPARLGALNWTAPSTLVAVGNLSGHAAVVLFKLAGGRYQAFAFTD